MSKIIFLDIDGVLQLPGSQKRFEVDLEEFRKEMAEKMKNEKYLKLCKYDIGAVYYDWAPDAVQNLRKLIETHDAQIVLISDWRIGRTLEEMQLLLDIHGLGKYLIEFAPDLPNNYKRSKEIAHYLSEHPEVKKFVIIDDIRDDYENMFPNNIVYTFHRYRFDEQCLEKAMKILSD